MRSIVHLMRAEYIRELRMRALLKVVKIPVCKKEVSVRHLSAYRLAGQAQYATQRNR